MVKAVSTGLRDRFAGVQASQEVHGLKEEVAELQAELAELRAGNLNADEQSQLQAEVQRLTAQLGDRSGKHRISLDLIDLDQLQPRSTITDNMVAERANSLKRHGQLTPIILIPQLTGRYLLFEGELRTRAARTLAWQELDAVFLSPEDIPSPEEVFRGQVVTSIHSQRLHDLDIAQALIRLAVHDYPNMRGQESIIPNFLNTPIRRMQRDNQLAQLAEIRIADTEQQSKWIEATEFKTQEERQIFALILGLQLNPVTVNSNVFPLLKLAPDLKEAIQTIGLEASKARELNRLSKSNLKLEEVEASQIRQAFTQQAIDRKLSLMEIKNGVNQLILQHNPKRQGNKNAASHRAIQLLKECDFSSDSMEDLKKLLTVLQSKTAEIRELIDGEPF